MKSEKGKKDIRQGEKRLPLQASLGGAAGRKDRGKWRHGGRKGKLIKLSSSLGDGVNSFTEKFRGGGNGEPPRGGIALEKKKSGGGARNLS